MQGTRHGLGEEAKKLDLGKPMRSRISDTLVPPPSFEKKGVEDKYDPYFVAKKMLDSLSCSELEARFLLSDHRGFTLIADKGGLRKIQPMEPFPEVPERLLIKHHGKVVKIEIFADDNAFSLSGYDDLIEWLEID